MSVSEHETAKKCAGARIEGEVQVGHGAILHPRCTVFAAPGAAVVIGAKTIIEELVEIRCNRGTVTIGERCLLQVGSRVQDSSVGADSQVEVKACLVDSKVGSNCSIGAMCYLQDHVVASNTSLHAPSLLPVLFTF
eukprot:Tamp_24134.p1 GENE.Tamp_24134~~Tamp_24134.p1  ORF type:complete len:136 (+),score=15.95 Tamp_24134:180-587(+)